MVAPEIAIADSNTLSCMGLQSLLEEIIPMAVIRVFIQQLLTVKVLNSYEEK